MKLNFFKTLAADIHHFFERYNFTFEPHPFMPSFERNFLELQYLDSSAILEFGSGGSTLFAIKNNKSIVSVESDRKFFNYLMHHIKKNYSIHDARILIAQTGLTGRYGMPLFFPFSPNVEIKGLSYILTGYSQFKNFSPDLIFVDGRWRVACCLYSLILGFGSSRLLLDDYENDRSYKPLIEKYFEVSNFGRIASLSPKSGVDIVELVNDFITSLKNPE
jgi:hypothetical protein